jgi:hypothetical protein
MYAESAHILFTLVHLECALAGEELEGNHT